MRDLLEGFTLGLSTGSFCLAGCVPLLLPYFISEKRKWTRDALILGEFLLGRMAAYLVFGAAVGLAGERAGSALAGRPAGVLLAVTSAMLLAHGLGRSFPNADFCRMLVGLKFLRRFPLAAGFLLGINACPPFLTAASAMFAFASMWRSLVFAFAFFSATTLFLLPFLFSSRLARHMKLRGLARTIALLSGSYFLVQGVLLALYPPLKSIPG